MWNINIESIPIFNPMLLFFWMFLIESEAEFNEFKPRLKSPKNRIQLSAGLYIEKFNTILSGPNHICAPT